MLLKKHFGFILVFIVSLIPLFALLHPGLPLTHDGQDHIARIANFYLSLSEGNLIPRWAENLNWGYGHPILMFLYPLPSYVASGVHLLGFSFVDSFKIVLGLSFILSGIFMYLWLKEFLGELSASAGAILYMFAPYRFVDLYIRGAIGEHIAFVFPPLICLFLLKLFSSKKFNSVYFVAASVSVAMLILAHNAVSLMFLPFIFLYILYLFWVSKKRNYLISSFVSIFLGFCLAAFFWLPAYLEGKYTLRDIVTGTITLDRFVNFQDLIYGPWVYGQFGQFTVQVGILQWVSIAAVPFVAYFMFKKKDKLLKLYLITFLYFLGSIFIMLPVSSFLWKTVTILEKFQFPWRFLSVSVFTTAILGAFLVSCLNKKVQMGLLAGIVLLALFLNKDSFIPHSYILKPEAFYAGIYNGTTDTGESSPVWSVRFMEERPKSVIEVIDGAAVIKKISRSSTHHKYQVNAKNRVGIRENTLYFPGWTVYIDSKKNEAVEFQDPHNRGIMTFYVPPGTHIIDVVFQNTKLRTISNLISITTLLTLGVLVFLRLRKTRT